jgi:phosphoglycerate dehydrogenase-like enzyme
MRVVVTSSSFSKNKKLQSKIYKYFPNAQLNLEGVRFNQSQLIEYLRYADATIVGLETINKEVLINCPNLKIISKFGVGLNNIDLDICSQRNIAIGWTGGINKLSVAEMVLGFMLMITRNLYFSSNMLKNAIWNKSGGFQLSGKTIGIIGLGHIGKEVVRLLKPFGCKLISNDLVSQDVFCTENNIKQVSKEEIFNLADIITIHTPYNKTTKGMINMNVLKSMKSSSYLINTARGGIVIEEDLKYALINNIISGAALDVYSEEPPEDKDFLKLPNLICTPHIGGNANEAVEAMGMEAIKHLKKYFNL